MKRFLRPFYLFYVILSFLLCLVLLFPVFWLFTLWPPSKAQRYSWSLVGHWARVWLRAIGMPVRVQGPVHGISRGIYIAPHRSYLDTLNIFAVIPQPFRPLGKQEVTKIPLLGAIYRQLTVTVERDRAESRSRSLIQLQRALERESSIMIFPEGGFNTSGQRLSRFYDGAFRLALNARVPIQPILFPDAEHRWNQRAWWALWPGPNRVIFMDPIRVADWDPTDIEGLKQHCYQLMDQALAQGFPPELGQ